jgi:hypothetical protein
VNATLFTKERYSVRDFARVLGKHPATIWRWMLKGVRKRRLASFLIGGQRYIVREDADLFLAALNECPTKPGTPSQKEPASREDADAALDREGF